MIFDWSRLSYFEYFFLGFATCYLLLRILGLYKIAGEEYDVCACEVNHERVKQRETKRVR